MFAAILGAHTLGSAKIENSGYEGFWSDSPGVFNNDYYRQMITRGWGPERAVNGNPERNQW
jgi:catalase (peroxidase I)